MGTYTGSDKRLQYLFQNGGGGGGTTVIANPQGAATDTLNKLQVGQTIYNVPSGGSGSHIYSTSEHVVGQWTDGKPVYEITYYIQNPVSGGNYPIVPNIKEVIDIRGTWQRKGTGYDWFYHPEMNKLHYMIHEIFANNDNEDCVIDIDELNENHVTVNLVDMNDASYNCKVEIDIGHYSAVCRVLPEDHFCDDSYFVFQYNQTIPMHYEIISLGL